MARSWQPGTQYNDGDVVVYQGQRYKIIQPHRSQGDWTPLANPALWGRFQDGDDYGEQHHGEQQHHGQQRQHQSYQQQQPLQQHGHGHGREKNDHEEEEKKEEIFGIDKDKFMIGAGILGGAALLGGGAALYKHHKEKKEKEGTERED